MMRKSMGGADGSGIRGKVPESGRIQESERLGCKMVRPHMHEITPRIS